MRIPLAIKRLIEAFEKLPGIGPKTAQRLTFYLLHVPQIQLEGFAEALVSLKKNTVLFCICQYAQEPIGLTAVNTMVFARQTRVQYVPTLRGITVRLW